MGGLQNLKAMGNSRGLNQIANQTSDKFGTLFNVDPNEAILIRQKSRLLNITTYTGGVKQVETATAAGTVTADPGGNATVTVTAVGMTGSPKAVTVPLLLGDDANAIATKIRAALVADTNISAFFDVSGETNKVVLTVKTTANNDTTMNIAIAVGTATGVTAAATSANTIKGSLNEIVHPDILFFPNGWNGWKYWLGNNAYDNGDSQFENPCINVSNDNVNWTVPAGLVNPIEPEPPAGFNADIALFMSPDNKTMYMVWKFSATTSTTYLRSSTDGVNWTPKVALFTNSFEDVSPTVVWDGDCYKMWTVKPSDTPNNIYVRTSADALTWSEPVLCTHNLPTGVEPWHLCVRKLGNQYHMLLHIAITALYFGVSENGIDWTFGEKPIYQDTGFVYRTTFWPMITDKGLKYGVWWNRITPYRVEYAEMTFDRTEQIRKASIDTVAAKNKIDPWIFCDTFNRTDTTAGLGTSDSGHAWTKSAGNEFGIANGKAYCTGTDNSHHTVNLGISDFYAEVTMVNVGTGKSGMLMFRWVDVGNWWRLGHSNGGYHLQKNVNYSASANLIFSMNADMADGDRLGVECKGDRIRIFHNGVIIKEIIDSTFKTSTKIGLGAANVVTLFDDIKAKTV
jgi:hypothetical protein